MPPGVGGPGPGMGRPPRGGRAGPGGEDVPGFPGAGQPNNEPASAKDGTVTILALDKTVVVTADLLLKEKAYGLLMDGATAYVISLRGEADAATTRSRVHELAAALQEYVKAKGHYPRGALHRPPSAERVIDWAPAQRLSWMVDLLPFLQQGEYKDLFEDRVKGFDATKSWRDPPNLYLGMMVIPQYVVLGKPNNPYKVRYPGMLIRLGATHFVGMAGVGLDAAEYDPSNPAVAKKLGIFGYNREIKPDQIKNPEQTIALIQVPVEHKAPWIAGGGSTVRGVSEDADALRPFVCAEYQGKPGTFAIMADGKVRFIPAATPPDTFRTLCTINGDKVRSLDEIAPEVPDESANELRTDITLAGGGRTPPPGWQEFAPADAGFSVFLPAGKIEEESQPIQQPGGKAITRHEFSRHAQAASFVVIYMDVPEDAKESPQELLDNARNGMLTSSANSELLKEEKISLGEHPGREFLVKSDKGTSKYRVFYARKRLFALIALTLSSEGAPAEKEIKTFFDSFQLTGDKPAEAPKPAAPAPPAEQPKPPEKKEPTPGGEAKATDPREAASKVAMAAIGRVCAQCHTGQRSKGDSIIFTAPGQFNKDAPWTAMKKAVEEGKMPPPRSPSKLTPEEATAIRTWIGG
jgi:hypothetical protein